MIWKFENLKMMVGLTRRSAPTGYFNKQGFMNSHRL
jgi:hypothetical protein